MSNETPPPVAPAARKRRSGWLLLILLLIPYVFLKFQALSYARQVAQMEKELDQLRPALSARVLSEQLENTRRTCQEVSDQVRRLDLRNGEFLEQLSNLPASITLERVEIRAGPRPQTGLKVQGVLSAGSRDPEWVLARWAQSLQGDGMSVHLRRLVPSAQDSALWSFELYLEGA